LCWAEPPARPAARLPPSVFVAHAVFFSETAHRINPRLSHPSPAPCCSCTAQPRRQQQAAAAAAAQPEAPSALLALSSLLLAGPALAEDAAPDAAAAADAASAGFAAPSAAGWALALSPLIFYGLFNLYRSQIDPKAKFGDAIFGKQPGWARRDVE
jgi:hypothetical protein